MTAPFSSPGSFVRDSDSFAPPTFGGAVACKFGTFDYTDTTAVTLFTLPAGAVVVDWYLNVSTGFNSSGTDLVDIGLGSDGDYFANDVNVATAGYLPPSTSGMVPSRLAGTALTEETAVTAQFAQSVADADEGEATFVLFYILR